MVGKAKVNGVHNLARKLRRSISHDPIDDHSDSNKPLRRRVPLIASPLDPKATEWLKRKHQNGNLTLRRRPTIAQFEAERIAGGIFRKQHEATTLELFFDLFFVANLAVFTNNHQHTSFSSLGNYVGFFSIMWFTWFHSSIYDVRFYVDSVFNRFCKVTSFGVFVAINGLGPVYDVIQYGGSSRAFRGVALVLMLSRLILFLQHAQVLYFVRDFKKTVLPLCLMMAVYFAVAMGFMATYLHQSRIVSVGRNPGLQHVIIWYCLLAAEAILVVIISSVWRILSFKYTHLVERVGLLTLIIMGEGIIGLVKSVSYILAGVNISLWDITGKIVAALMLIYEVYLLYFSPIDHDRFGTIRQQIWAIMHYPLHVSILLTEEGSSVTLLWDAVMDAREWLRVRLPDPSTASETYTSNRAFVNAVNLTMNQTAERYHYRGLIGVYNYNVDLWRLGNLTEPFGSDAWSSKAEVIVGQMFTNTSNYFFANFRFDRTKEIDYTRDPYRIQSLYFSAYQSTFVWMFVAAGGILLTMAAMYWIGKRNKSREEWAAIIIRIIVGLGLPLTVMAAYLDRSEEGFIFKQSNWIIPIVTFALLLVVLIDNHINTWVDRKLDDYEEDPEHGMRKEKTHGPGDHRYGALHGYADAQAASMHFAKPSYSQGPSDSADWTTSNPQSRAQSRNPSRRPSISWEDQQQLQQQQQQRPRNIDDEDEERLPFVNATDLPPQLNDSDNFNPRASSDTAPQLPMPSPLSVMNANYMPYGEAPSYPAPTAGPSGYTGRYDPVPTREDSTNVRRYQLYEPTMVTPSSAEATNGWQSRPGRGGYGEA